MYIPLLIAMLYLYKMNTKLQPFYNINLNSFRGGIFGFFIFVGLFSILQSIINANTIFLFIGSVAAGLVGFAVGAMVSAKLYKRCVENIYFRYKMDLNINDPDMVTSDSESEEEEEEDVENEDDEYSESAEENNNNEALISVASDSQEGSDRENEDENSSNSDSRDSSNQSDNDDDELTLFNSIYKISRYPILY